ncbi:MAG: nucleoside transporter C-terminal domain-containing protein [Cryomorphaceae bacterium]
MTKRNILALAALALFIPATSIAQASGTTPIETNITFVGILRGLLGIAVLVGIGWLFSEKKKAISWSLVAKGLVLQLILAILVLEVPFFSAAFDYLSRAFVKVISFTDFGSDFLFRSFTDGSVDSSMLNFAFRVLPTIIFFSALMSLLYYLGLLQKIVYAFAWIMRRTLKLSGAESLAAAGNIFLGQTESPLLVKPYLGVMTRSEMNCLMTGGMATIAGGVLASYIGFLGGDSDVERIIFAKHLLTASIMSAPAAIISAKLLVPETESFRKDMSMAGTKEGSNALEAISTGTTDGIKLAVNVGAMLLVFTALIYMANYILGDWFGSFTGLNAIIAENTIYEKFTLEFIIGYLFAPLAWLIGVPAADMVLVGQLLGEKTILNEFYAYVTLGDLKATGRFAENKSMIMATYILCGFANFASIGIQIGGIGALIPTRKGLLSKLGVKALIGGTLASLFTAALVGMFL